MDNVPSLSFESEAEFNYWLTIVVSHHEKFLSDRRYPPSNPSFAPNGLVRTSAYLCDHSGSPPSTKKIASEDDPANHTSSRSKSSVPPTGFLSITIPLTLVKSLAWLDEKVGLRMDWIAISALLLDDDDELDVLENQMEIRKQFPKALKIDYRAVQKHDPVKVEQGLEKGYSGQGKRASLQHPGEDASFLVSRSSPWQKALLESAEEWSLDSTHKTLVVNPSTRRGVPVCFFITNAEVTTVLTEWLIWLKQCSLNVKRIMIDCSAMEMGAIRNAFGGECAILLCHWHIKRAWDTNLKKLIRVPHATAASQQLQRTAYAMLSDMMYSCSGAEFDAIWLRFKAAFSDHDAFIKYFTTKQWIPKTSLWVKTYRMHSQRQVPRNFRVDRIIYVLTTHMMPDYGRASLMVGFGFAATLNKKGGELRMVIDYRKLNDMTIKDAYLLPLIDDVLGSLGGATVYEDMERGERFGWTSHGRGDHSFGRKCRHKRDMVLGICKHMFFAARVLKISCWRPVYGTHVSDEFKQSLLLDNKEQVVKMKRLLNIELDNMDNWANNSNLNGLMEMRQQL
ncbi:hypothetical protein [Absidia glauca]|uniref:MULE transposase domain-containing protein n=1 Tax=Absidia glauca TaxID=4829 RepID=A0A163JW43_ABSGL|nr:hypothetical protein [Absidia glauca]